jgi:hypothetical protein
MVYWYTEAKMTTSENNTTKDQTKRSTIITIISLFYILVGLITAFVNTISVALQLYGYATRGRQEPIYYLLLLIVGMVSGIIAVIAGIGLWKLKRWAYLAAIAISGLLILVNLFASSFIPIIFHALILVGLFSKGVKATYTSS